MNCQEVSGLLDAYLDKELDVITSSKFDRHLTDCPACRARSDQYRQMHESVKAQMEYFQGPEEFAQRLRAGLYSSGQAEERTSARMVSPLAGVGDGRQLNRCFVIDGAASSDVQTLRPRRTSWLNRWCRATSDPCWQIT
jgi:anti-sigma factor RsiW